MGLELPIALLVTYSLPTSQVSPMDRREIKIHNRKQNRTPETESEGQWIGFRLNYRE